MKKMNFHPIFLSHFSGDAEMRKPKKRKTMAHQKVKKN